MPFSGPRILGQGNTLFAALSAIGFLSVAYPICQDTTLSQFTVVLKNPQGTPLSCDFSLVYAVCPPTTGGAVTVNSIPLCTVTPTTTGNGTAACCSGTFIPVTLTAGTMVAVFVATQSDPAFYAAATVC